MLQMAKHQIWLLLSFFLLKGFFLEAAKILTISTFGGSHYLVIHRVSQILQDHGHNVTNLLFKNYNMAEEEKSYRVINWLLPEDQQKEFENRLHLLKKEFSDGRFAHNDIEKAYEQFGYLCSHLLSRSEIMDSLRNEDFDLVIFDAVDFCSFLLCEKLGKPFVPFLPLQFNYLNYVLPSPLSYVPVLGSSLTDQMNFWARVKNFLMFFEVSTKRRKILSHYDRTIQEHFAEGSWPVLSDLLLKAELWFINSDFALEFARPLFPNTVYLGGLMDKPAKPVPQDLENFITKFGDSGFVLVALGSVASMYQTKEFIQKINSAFAHIPQGVLWTCKNSSWPKDVRLAPNVKIMDWLPQNDLLAHPSIRLFVTHGGINSIMEAIHHGVPMVGIPFFGDQPENMIRVEAKKIGVTVHLQTLKAETLALTMKEVIEDKRYKAAAMAARAIRHSHPLPSAQRLVGWVDHILQTGGGAHLRPYVFQQSWYEQYLLDVILFLLGVTVCFLWLCGMVLGAVARNLTGAKKMKQT